MSYELHSSAVITGSLNCFCLACECFLQNEDEAMLHVKSISHCDTLNLSQYLDKFTDHNIRKFKFGYFCAFCNKLMPTLLHVNLHLSEQCHQQNRGTYLLKHMGPNVIAFNNLLIKENAWHGIIDDVCCICATEFEDEFLHKKDTAHILSLMQKLVQFGENDVIYRLLDDLSFHCITCNKLLPLNTMSKHFKDDDHLDLYLKCKVLNKDDHSIGNCSSEHITDASPHENYDNDVHNINSDTKNCEHNQDNIIDSETGICVTNTSTEDITHSKESEKKSQAASNETSAESDKPINGTTFIINDHNKNSENSNLGAESNTSNGSIHESIKKGRDSRTGSANQLINNDMHEQPISNDLKTIAIDNNMTYTNSHMFCKMCQVSLPFNLKSMEEHIKGVRHTKQIMATLVKRRMEEFVHSLLRVQGKSEMEINSGYLINDKYYITLLSHLLLIENTLGVGLTCLLCGDTLPEYPEVPVAHIDGCSLPKGRHIQVITSIEDEYIRAIRTATFHCGFCHTVVPGWHEMQRHLRSPEHGLQKSQSYERFNYIKLRLLSRMIQIIEINH